MTEKEFKDKLREIIPQLEKMALNKDCLFETRPYKQERIEHAVSVAVQQLEIALCWVAGQFG